MQDGVSACLSNFKVHTFHSWSNAFGVSSSNPLPFRQLFEAFGGSPIGIAICDRRLRFVTVNRRLAEIDGIPSDNHPGKFVRDIVGVLAPVVETRLIKVFNTGRPLQNEELIGQLGANPKSGHWIENYFPIFGGRNRVIQVGVFVLSISGLYLRNGQSVAAPGNEPAPNAECELRGERSCRGILSYREMDLLRLLANGQSTKEAAASLVISVKTAETYRARLMLKLHTHSLAKLVQYAIRQGIIDLHE
jgi:DNA-binding CsgD family transcriptional regulator